MSDRELLEQVEVVGYWWKTEMPVEIGGGYGHSYASHWSTGPSDAEPLMTVKQHERILAAATAQPAAPEMKHDPAL